MPKPLLLCLVVALGGCQRERPGAKAALDRQAFNRIAAELAYPLFWVVDDDGPGELTPEELAVLWGVDQTQHADWVANGQFTPRFARAKATIEKAHRDGHDFSGLSEAERRRRTAVIAELAQGKPTLVFSDFTGASPEDRTIVTKIMAAAQIIEELYAKQNGVADMAAKIPADDSMSRMLFYRNQTPWCSAPETEKNPDCNALAIRPPRLSGLYPAALQANETFCEQLTAAPDQKTLMSPFVIVAQNGDGNLHALPYNEAYGDEMQRVSKLLGETAGAIRDPKEASLKAYIEAAAQAFLDNDWQPADEAWAAMNVNNSKWYLRIGPDETYFEPCGRKAGFHVSFARINQGSSEWQKRLNPLKSAMEKAIADLAGPPYQPHQVSFHMPDFIDMVLNAGDARDARGATIGQSLPNWGPVANEGRGRTVVMTNLYTDPDSRAVFREQSASVFCAATMAKLQDSQAPQVMSTVLHEAAHNLGPAHEYAVNGKVDDEIFGGPLAAVIEELKAQTAALYLADWLVPREIISRQEAQVAFAHDIAWAINHIARGMYTADDKPRTYSQLASIQGGYLRAAGALEWKAAQTAANGKDEGCFEIHFDKTPAVVEKLMAQVAGIKGRGDKPGAEELIQKYVDAQDEWAKLREEVGARWRRAPKASFVYAVRL